MARYTTLRRVILLPFAVVQCLVMIGAYTAGATGATIAARQINGLVNAAVGGMIVALIYFALDRLLRRILIPGLADGHSAALPIDAPAIVPLKADLPAAAPASAVSTPPEQIVDRVASAVHETRDPLQAQVQQQRLEIEHLTMIIDALPEGVIVLSNDSRVLLVNATARGWTKADSEALDVIFAAVNQTLTEADQALAEGETLIGTIHDPPPAYPHLLPIGPRRRVALYGRILEAHRAALLSWSGERAGTIILLRDVTAAARWEAARRALGSDALSSGGEGARLLARTAPYLQKLISELRDQLWMTEPINAAIREMDVEALVWSVANDWRQVIGAANLRLDVHLDTHGTVVFGDERRLRWALGSLIDSAIKHTPADIPGRRVLALEMKGVVDGFVQIRVRDSGMGIEPEMIGQIFQPQQPEHLRLLNGTAEEPERQLLALRSARAIIAMHGGRLEIRSQPGEGTSVSVWLPLTAPALAAPASDDNGDTRELTPNQ